LPGRTGGNFRVAGDHAGKAYEFFEEIQCRYVCRRCRVVAEISAFADVLFADLNCGTEVVGLETGKTGIPLVIDRFDLLLCYNIIIRLTSIYWL